MQTQYVNYIYNTCDYYFGFEIATLFLLNSTTAPSHVRNVTVVPINSSAIHVTWDPPVRPNGRRLRYRVIVPSSPIHTCETNDTSLVVGDLKPNTKYYVTISAVNDAGKTEFPDEFIVRTAESSMYVQLCLPYRVNTKINHIYHFKILYHNLYLLSCCIPKKPDRSLSPFDCETILL